MLIQGQDQEFYKLELVLTCKLYFKIDYFCHVSFSLRF